MTCPNCGTESGTSSKFCRQCGFAMQSPADDAATWRLAAGTQRDPHIPTNAVNPMPTAESQPGTGPAYIPPVAAYAPAPYQPSPPLQPVAPPAGKIAIADWIFQGWDIYKKSWGEMSVAALFGAFLTVISAGILYGPLLMGLHAMALKTLRGQRAEVSDLFKWEGRFLQALLASVIAAVIFFAVTGAFGGHLSGLLFIAITPFLTTALALILPMLSDRRLCFGDTIREVTRLLFSRDTLMWWVLGLVLLMIASSGSVLCGLGVFLTFPLAVCIATVAYDRTFGYDPNRTMH